MGAEAVDAVVKSRVVELRWTKAVSDDGFSHGGKGGDGGDGGDNGDDGDEGDNGDMVFERPRVVAMTPVLRKAMEIVMREDEGLTEDGGGG